MEAPGSYLTLRDDATAELVVSRSRFLATVRRVGDEEQAAAVVSASRRAHPAARHHCWAWRFADGRERGQDDGEPSGTAGQPMLEVLRGHGLTDVVAVVSRHFGGTLLGAGGLVRAYGGAVASALDGAATVRRSPVQRVGVTVDHLRAGALQAALRARGISVDEVTYGAAVELEVALPAAGLDGLTDLVATVTRGDGTLADLGWRWSDGTGR